MASIRNSINLQDRMSPVFKSIITSMNSTLKVMRNLDSQANNGKMSKAYIQAEKDIKKANNALIQMKNNLANATTSANKFGTASSKAMSSWNKGAFNLVNLSAALYLLKNISSTVSGIMDAPDMARSTQARLGLFNESEYSSEQLYSGIYQTALNTRTGLQETGDLASRILVSGAMTGPGAAIGAINTTGIINKALVAGGGTSEENKRSLIQLSQALASGKLQGDELRSIREQTPYLMKVMAEGLAKVDPGKFAGVTVGQLKQLGADGELTSDRIIKAFNLMSGKIDENFEKMPKTFGQAMTQMGTVWKYFLFMLSMGDGALAKINKKAWELSDFLSSPAGSKMLTQLAYAISVVVDIALWGIDLIASGIRWLSDNTSVLYGIIWGLGGVLVAVAVTAFAGWISVAWPFILLALVIGIVVAGLINMGVTSGEIVGYIAGGVAWLVAVIWDGILFLLSGIYIVCASIWDVIQALLALVWNTIVGVVMSIGGVLGVLVGAIESCLIIIVGLFQGLSDAVLGVIWGIAKAIDLVFGSNLAGSVAGWMSTVNQTAANMYSALDPRKMPIFQSDTWKDAPWASYDWALVDPTASSKFLAEQNLIVNPMDAYKSGYDGGKGLADKIGNRDFSMDANKLEGFANILKNWDPASTTINGGNLDSIGKIKSDVNIADEDLKLLKDMAAREFLLNLKSITPQANITFGDVRETADVGKIMAVLETMVENALATSLVAD